MTSGERMVWAAEFVRARASGVPRVRAVEEAHEAVRSLRLARHHIAESTLADGDARAMLDDVLGNGADR